MITDAEALAAAVRELHERPSGLLQSCNPLIANILARWARLASIDPDLLHRVGGAETVTLARHIIGQHAACPTCDGTGGDHQIGCQETP